MKIGVLGGSGNVGRLVVKQLLSYDDDTVHQVKLFNRRILNDDEILVKDSRLQQYLVDMTSVETFYSDCIDLLTEVEVIVSMMGIGPGKGSAELFRKVEVELPVAFAHAAKAAGATRAVLLTAIGANINSNSSWLVGGVAEGKFFYFKGLVEQKFIDTAFAEGVTVCRPAGLLGTGHTPKWLDRILPKIDWLAPARFRSMHIHRLADAMARTVVNPKIQNTDGATILEGHALLDLLQGERWESD